MNAALLRWGEEGGRRGKGVLHPVMLCYITLEKVPSNRKRWLFVFVLLCRLFGTLSIARAFGMGVAVRRAGKTNGSSKGVKGIIRGDVTTVITPLEFGAAIH